MNKMTNDIVNKVASSGLITIDLEEWYGNEPRSVIHIHDFLYEGLILREKDFREQLKNTDWSVYTNHHITIDDTVDAIVPTWAYMLLTIALQPYATSVQVGTLVSIEDKLFLRKLQQLNLNDYVDKRVVVKGCGEKNIPLIAYTELARLLTPVAKSIMYGEPCSTVPLYKKV
jgi:Protein of unknown function (DUF2480)